VVKLCSNALRAPSALIQPHDAYLSLGISPEERCNTYHSLVMQAISSEELQSIRLHLQRQHAYGSERFRTAIEVQLGRRAGPAKIGRPRKHKLSEESSL
jgi:putative transposase